MWQNTNLQVLDCEQPLDRVVHRRGMRCGFDLGVTFGWIWRPQHWNFFLALGGRPGGGRRRLGAAALVARPLQQFQLLLVVWRVVLQAA